MDAMTILASVFLIFIPALMLPGPDFIAMVRSSMVRGTRAGLLTTCGVSAGLGLYATVSMLGLSAILINYQWLAWTIRVLGGCYLVYLGIRLAFTKPAKVDIKIEAGIQRGHPLVFGFLVTLTNPKAVILFTSVFATTVSESTPTWLMLLMIGLVISSSLVWYAIVSLFMSSARMVDRFRDAQHWIERAAGLCFIGIGGRILADARNPVSP